MVVKSVILRFIVSPFSRGKKSFEISSKMKERFMRATVESGEASSSAPLGPLLGQFQVSIIEFCESFNEVTAEVYEESVPLGVSLYKYAVDFMYYIRHPSCTFFFHQVYLDYGWDLDEVIFDYYNVEVEDLWFIVKRFSAVFELSYARTSKIIFGYLRSSVVRLKIFG